MIVTGGYMADVPTIRITDTPILQGFQWTYSFAFATGTQMTPTQINLNLFNVYFAIQQGLNKITPTVATFANGLAKITLSAIQTRQMGLGIYKGHIFLEDKISKDVSFFANIEAEVILPIPS